MGGDIKLKNIYRVVWQSSGAINILFLFNVWIKHSGPKRMCVINSSSATDYVYVTVQGIFIRRLGIPQKEQIAGV